MSADAVGGDDANEPYLFGFDDAWLLAPERDGAHNWEGQGHLNALQSLVALSRLAQEYSTEHSVERHADTTRVFSAGHSRGGHGASNFAVKYPDRTLALSMASGWYAQPTPLPFFTEWGCHASPVRKTPELRARRESEHFVAGLNFFRQVQP